MRGKRTRDWLKMDRLVTAGSHVPVHDDRSNYVFSIA
jgi:hypothetical protein